MQSASATVGVCVLYRKPMRYKYTGFGKSSHPFRCIIIWILNGLCLDLHTIIHNEYIFRFFFYIFRSGASCLLWLPWDVSRTWLESRCGRFYWSEDMILIWKDTQVGSWNWERRDVTGMSADCRRWCTAVLISNHLFNSDEFRVEKNAPNSQVGIPSWGAIFFVSFFFSLVRRQELQPLVDLGRTIMDIKPFLKLCMFSGAHLTLRLCETEELWNKQNSS